MSAAVPLSLTPPNLDLRVASGDVLDVREYHVTERISGLFELQIVALASNPNVDFDAVVGKEGSFSIRHGLALTQATRTWQGLVNDIQQIAVEEDGASTYKITVVPKLWLLTQRRNHRMFQQKSEPEIVLELLAEWGIEPDVRLSLGDYKKRRYRVQYAESDFSFVCRMLEDVGISFFFEQQGEETKLVLSDAPHDAEPRAPSVRWVGRPSYAPDREHVTALNVRQQTRPGRYTIFDVDYRLPSTYKLAASIAAGDSLEQRLERFHYVPGAFLFGTAAKDATPIADDRGAVRSDEGEAERLAKARLDAKRAEARAVVFQTNVWDLRPGVVMAIDGHPRSDVAEDKPLLVLAVRYHGTANGHWVQQVETRSALAPFRPPLSTPKPRVQGIESATVVGPKGEEIHTDEFGRVRVHFHWDRESRRDETSSCWIPVSQPWAGAGYGGIAIPRVGQEVIVDFLGGDPDRPVVVGRVFTNLQKVPYGLPGNKTQTVIRSNSSPSTGGFNELMFEDAAGRELVRFQAEKDFTGLVKNDSAMVVQNDETHYVGNDDVETVMRDQTVKVGRDRQLRVHRDQVHMVDRHVSEQAVNGHMVHRSEERLLLLSNTEMILKVGSSTIQLLPDQINIQATDVHINPGSDPLPAPPQPPVVDGVRQQEGHYFGSP